jgi:hypothetical protein
MINKKTISTQYYPNDYQIVYADEYLSLIKVGSIPAFNFFSKNDDWFEEVTNYNIPVRSTYDIFIANTEEGDVFVFNFPNKHYLLNGKSYSLYQWLKLYPQLIDSLIDVGLKHHVLALEIHQEGLISDKAYEDAIEESVIFYESERLLTCPQARKAILTLAPHLIVHLLRNITEVATEDEKLLVVQIDGETLCYFEETATKQQRKIALKEAPHIIHRLENRTHLEVIKALTNYSTESDFILHSSQQERLRLIEEYPEIIEILYPTSTKQERAKALNEDGTVIRFFTSVSKKERRKTLKQDAHAILYLSDVTEQERLTAIAQNPFIIGKISDVTFDELSLAFQSTCEDGYQLTVLPFKKVAGMASSPDYEEITNQQSFINSITSESMPKRVFYDEGEDDFCLVFQY